jgi:hypothetical protein
MNYFKKTCILRQVRQGFSADGKTLSGLVKIEQYGKNVSAEVSILNFAPLSAGEYYCLLADAFSRTELLPLRGKSLFNIISGLDVSAGFCAVICFVKEEVLPIAYGVNGQERYEWRKIIENAFQPLNKTKGAGTRLTDESAVMNSNPTPLITPTRPSEEERARTQTKDNRTNYNDELLAEEDYFREEEGDERRRNYESSENAQTESYDKEPNGEVGADFEENDDAQDVLHPFKTDTDGYYQTVKSEIDELFARYPKDDTLNGVFSCSEWVRIKGDEGSPQYLVGVVYENWQAKYVCYALPAEDSENPPDEIKDVCTFVPVSHFDDTIGFFVIFQSASTGECIRPDNA